jgi:hypothetical protein
MGVSPSLKKPLQYPAQGLQHILTGPLLPFRKRQIVIAHAAYSSGGSHFSLFQPLPVFLQTLDIGCVFREHGMAMLVSSWTRVRS